MNELVSERTDGRIYKGSFHKKVFSSDYWFCIKIIISVFINFSPAIIVHKDTTVASSHVFEPVYDGAKCRSTIAVKGNTTAGENQQICLRTE